MKVAPPPCRPESPDLDSILVEGVAEPGLPPAQYVALPVGTNGEFLSAQRLADATRIARFVLRTRERVRAATHG